MEKPHKVEIVLFNKEKKQFDLFLVLPKVSMTVEENKVKTK